MDDADIVYTIMAVKEMIHYGYELNEAQFDDLIANGVILDGELPFDTKQKTDSNPASMRNSNYLSNNAKYSPLSEYPRFHVPKFQAKVLSRAPHINRSKLLFPINLAEFAFADGVSVKSGQ